MTKDRYNYQEGQRVQINIGSLVTPEWVEGEVTDIRPKTRESLRLLEGILRVRPIIVRVSEEANAWAGAEIKVYQDGDKVRPKSVNR